MPPFDEKEAGFSRTVVAKAAHRVLLVEGNVVSQEVALGMLELLGCKVAWRKMA